MRWILDITDSELIEKFGEVIFTTILPENRPELFDQIAGNLYAGSLTYQIHILDTPETAFYMLEHPDTAQYELTDNLFNSADNFCINIMCPFIASTLINVLYDRKNYLMLVQIDQHVYKFNFGFYLMLLQINEIAQLSNLPNIIGSLLDKREENENLDDLEPNSNLVM